MASTKEVLDHHLKCFAEGDLEGILSDYAPGAVLFTPDGPLKGAEAIRPLFQAMVAEFGKRGATVEFGKPGATFSLEQQFIEGDYVTFCGAQRLSIMCTRWARTPSLCGTARS
jgi:ketosteroid isomerase-like protein